MQQHVGAALRELLGEPPVQHWGVAVAAVDLGRHHFGCWLVGH